MDKKIFKIDKNAGAYISTQTDNYTEMERKIRSDFKKEFSELVFKYLDLAPGIYTFEFEVEKDKIK